MAKKEDDKPKHRFIRHDPAGIAFIGFILFGLGLGLAYERPDVGVLVGLGIGFVVMAIIKLFHHKIKGE